MGYFEKSLGEWLSMMDFTLSMSSESVLGIGCASLTSALGDEVIAQGMMVMAADSM